MIRAIARLFYFLATGFLLLALVVRAFPDAPPLGEKLLLMSVAVVSVGISKKLSESK